jgi:hypothetical protein
MRHRILLAALAAIPLGAGCAIFVAAGPSLAPYQGRPLRQAVEERLGITLKQLPHWAVSVAASIPSARLDSSAFVAPACYNATPAEVQSGKDAGCHPLIGEPAEGLEMQYRWSPTQSVHPLASVALGTVTNWYGYRTRTTFHQHDSLQHSTVVTLGGGGEFNLARWLHVALIGGYRESVGGKTIPNETVSHSGFTLTSLLIVGKPYRDP